MADKPLPSRPRRLAGRIVGEPSLSPTHWPSFSASATISTAGCANPPSSTTTASRVERERREQVDRGSRPAGRIAARLDDFDRALTVDADGSAGYRKGVELIHAKLNDILRKRGVRPFDTLGTDFDPNMHQAVIHESSPDHREGEVIGELRRGYAHRRQAAPSRDGQGGKVSKGVESGTTTRCSGFRGPRPTSRSRALSQAGDGASSGSQSWQCEVRRTIQSRG